jgi:hypothetical protein
MYIITYWFCCRFIRKLITAWHSSIVPQEQEHHFCPPSMFITIWGIWSLSAAGCMVIKMGDAIKYDLGGDVCTWSDITSLTPRLQNVLPPSLPHPNAYHPMPNVPSFHLTSVFNSSSRAAPSSIQLPQPVPHPPHLPPLCVSSIAMYESP